MVRGHTYDIDTSVPRNGDDGVETSEIDTYEAGNRQPFVAPET